MLWKVFPIFECFFCLHFGRFSLHHCWYPLNRDCKGEEAGRPTSNRFWFHTVFLLYPLMLSSFSGITPSQFPDLSCGSIHILWSIWVPGSCKTSASSGYQNEDGALGILFWHSAPCLWQKITFSTGALGKDGTLGIKKVSLPRLWKSKWTFPHVQTVTQSWPVNRQRRPEAFSRHIVQPNEIQDWWDGEFHSFGPVTFQK